MLNKKKKCHLEEIEEESIQKKYFKRRSSSTSSEKSSSSSTSSSSGGFYKYRKGEYIKDYLIKKHISDGTFGRVLKVEKKSKSYAMKIVRRGHTESAKSETEILKFLNKK